MTEPRLQGDLQGGFTPLTTEDWGDFLTQYIYNFVPEYERAYAKAILQNAITALQANIDAGAMDEASASNYLASIGNLIQVGGINHPSLLSDPVLQKLGIKDLTARMRDYVKAAAQEVEIDGKKFLYLGGYFYNTSADRLPQELQASLTERASQLEEYVKAIEEGRRELPLAEAERQRREIDARKTYFDQQKWWEKEGSEQIVGYGSMWKPEQAVGLSPEEALKKGYASYTPQFNQESYNKAFEEALKAEAWRFIGGGEPGTAGYTEQGYQTYGDVWKKLTPAQQQMISQKALQAGAGPPTLYTGKELREASKEGVDVSAASKALVSYQVEHPQQGVPYSQRGGDGMHINEFNRRKRERERWAELVRKQKQAELASRMRPEGMVSL